jgi:hypothetical protein
VSFCISYFTFSCFGKEKEVQGCFLDQIGEGGSVVVKALCYKLEGRGRNVCSTRFSL